MDSLFTCSSVSKIHPTPRNNFMKRGNLKIMIYTQNKIVPTKNMSLGSVTRREFRIPHGANFQLVFDKSGRFICKRLSPMFMSVKAQRW